MSLLSGHQIIERGLVRGARPEQARPKSVRLTLGGVFWPALEEEARDNRLSPYGDFKTSKDGQKWWTLHHPVIFRTAEILEPGECLGIFSPVKDMTLRGISVQGPFFDPGYKGPAHFRVDGLYHAAEGLEFVQVAFYE